METQTYFAKASCSNQARVLAPEIEPLTLLRHSPFVVRGTLRRQYRSFSIVFILKEDLQATMNIAHSPKPGELVVEGHARTHPNGLKAPR